MPVGAHAPAADGAVPLLSTRLSDPATGLTGWVVVDSLVNGLAMGGARVTESVTEQEVAALARAMTVKLGLVGLPIGGAKAGIRATADREPVLRAFGRSVAPLLHGGVYLGCDQGTTHADRDLFLAEAGYDVCRLPQAQRLPVDWPTLWEHLAGITGFGVSTGTLVALGTDTRPRRVAIQGFGTVGRAVARELASAGHVVVGVADVLGTIHAPEGLAVPPLIDITDATGSIDRARLPDGVRYTAEPEAWLDVDADVLVLAAGGEAIREDNVHRVRAGLVVEGGNLCVTPEAGRLLHRSGRTVVPGVVVNVGGAAVTGCVLAGLVPTGLTLSELVSWFYDWVATRVRRNLVDLLEIAAASDADPVADLLVARRSDTPDTWR